MKERTEQFEVLKSVVAVAAADGVITRSELGLIAALGGRIGIGRRALNVLVERARQHRRMHEELGRYSVGDTLAAMELLVGAAGIDGDIADEERDQLEIIAAKLGLGADPFEAACRKGAERARRLRASRDREDDAPA